MDKQTTFTCYLCCICYYYSKNAEMSWPLGLTSNNDNNKVGLRRICHVSNKNLPRTHLLLEVTSFIKINHWFVFLPYLQTFETGNKMHMIHSVALMCSPLCGRPYLVSVSISFAERERGRGNLMLECLLICSFHDFICYFPIVKERGFSHHQKSTVCVTYTYWPWTNW